ncbi:putative WD repeat-containing protein [Escovopsis weberi]|uniref:Putative WD repeat-containing protein n=1 Tax=Escovopsis weberi TaxID=150374 RepID=A0A0M8N6Y2_ESCWE|nr:putative WD repeat-containing protein [Escovopsis weberi]
MASPMSSGQAHPTSRRDENMNAKKSPAGRPSASVDHAPDPDSQFSLYPRRLTSRLALQTGKGKDVKDSKDSKDAREPQESHDPNDPRESKTLSSSLSPSTSPVTTPDPLGTQILLRTNTSAANDSIAARLRSSGRHESLASDELAGQDAEAPARTGLADLPRERRSSRGTSFFSRLTMRSKKHDEPEDCESDQCDSRTEISSYPATTSVTSDCAGYIPLHKEPPRYIRSKPCNTKQRHLNRLFLAQELMGARRPKEHEQSQGRMPATAVGTKILKAGDAIWAAEFSNDGQYLAVAGKDQVVRVFAVITTEEERKQEEEDRNADKEGPCKGKEKLDAPVFRSKPIRELKAHTGEVLALCWSKNNFLLSASMDKTVQLWHLTREESLATFKHNDLVTSIAFHPTDDRFFLSGSLDGQLRLWSIPDKQVAYSMPTQEFITAVAFSPEGKTAICGVLSGLCWFYDTDGLKFQFKIHVRSSRGKNAKGSKITGIKTVAYPSDSSQKAEVRVMISSNDSRIRIYNLKTRMMEVKLKGLENQCSQIHARFSDDGAYVISGSEDRRAYIWNMSDVDSELKDRQPYETFDAHPEVVTTALMAPTRTRQLLSASGDPIYDLCNPPPVLLRSLDEAAVSQVTLSEYGHAEPSKPSGASVHSSTKKPVESPAYQKRCHHPDGNIIVTTDRTGTIKVFRQDCAFQQRQQNQWDMSSKFSRVSGIGRSGSIMTRASGGSARTSLNLNMTQAHQPCDRIMSWRQEVDHGHDRVSGTTHRSEQSAHQAKPARAPTPVRPSSPSGSSEVEKQPVESASPAQAARGVQPVRVTHPASPSSSVRTRQSLTFGKEYSYDSHGPTYPPTPSFSLITAADSEEQDKGDWSFWNFGRWGGGLSKLRYSMSSPSSPVEGGPSAEPNGRNLAPGGWRPSDRTTARRSMGTSDLKRLRAVEEEKRRKSSIPMVTPRAFADESVGPVPLPGGEAFGASRDSLTLKKRTDSGVGRLSAESKV